MDTMKPNGSVARFPIVVGIDFDESGDHAFFEAMRISSGIEGAELHLVHVLTEVPPESRATATIDKTADLLTTMPQTLRAFVTERLAGQQWKTAPPIMIHVRIGAASEALTQLSADIDADLIIVGTHARKGLSRLLNGSVAMDLVQNAHCPVIVARPKNYDGVERSAHAEPVCPDCAKVRSDSNGEVIWCEYHSRPQIRPHTYGYSESYATAPHDPGIIPNT